MDWTGNKHRTVLTSYDFSKSKLSQQLKQELLNDFCSTGLLHGVSHFYLPQVLVVALKGKYFYDFLAAYSVNAFNRFDFRDLDMVHNIFVRYHSEFQITQKIGDDYLIDVSPEKLGDLSKKEIVDVNHVITDKITKDQLFTISVQECLSRVTIVHIKKLIDKGKLFRAKKLCLKYKADTEFILRQALIIYMKTPPRYKEGSGIIYSDHLEGLENLEKTISKLLFKRIRYEGLLLAIATLAQLL